MWFCGDQKRSTFDGGSGDCVAPSRECDGDECAKGRPHATSVYDARRSGAFPPVIA